MLPSNLEYIPLRLLRRFVFRDAFLLKWGRVFPYYRTNHNQTDPAPLADAYIRHVPLAAGARDILEIGVGATNSTGYEIAARCPKANLTLLEPFVPLDKTADESLLRSIAGRHRTNPAGLASRVQRITELADTPAASFDLVLSSSVLEHVADPAGLFAGLHRVLRPAGQMLHLVDYRDHFFKYPFHFLQFPRSTWMRWLDPGDLPRWRAYDHVELLEKAGFTVSLAEVRHDPENFARIRPRLSADFRRDDPLTDATFAALLVRPRR